MLPRGWKNDTQLFFLTKKNTLHEPNGCHFYVHDLTKDVTFLSRGYEGDSFVLIWTCFPIIMTTNWRCAMEIKTLRDTATIQIISCYNEIMLLIAVNYGQS